MPSFDLNAVIAVQHTILSWSFGVPFAVFCAKWLIGLEALLIGVFLFSKHRAHRSIVGQAVVALGIALIIVSGIGYLVQRPRPYLASSLVQLLIAPPLKTSFPSGHTSAAFAMAFIAFALDRRVGIVAIGMAIIVAFGRIAVGAHYPTDILGGILVGALSALMTRWLHRNVWERRGDRHSQHA